jgi:hypothetical protein
MINDILKIIKPGIVGLLGGINCLNACNGAGSELATEFTFTRYQPTLLI